MPKTVDKCLCCSCGESLAMTKFYNTISRFYTNGVLPICKECFNRKFTEYAKLYQSNKKAIQRMCMAFDVYYSEELFDSCDTKDEAVVGRYFRKLNMLQYKNKTFEDTLDSGLFELSGDRKRIKGKRVAIVDEYDNVQEETAEDNINKKDIEKWGIGFDLLDYEVLNSHYKVLKKANPNMDDNQEIFITDLCYAKMQQMKALRENRVDDYNKLTENYRKTFQQSGIKIVKDTSVTDDFTLGVNAEVIERYTPVEYYKDKSLFKDHDNIGDYVSRFLFRPLKNLMYGTNDRDFEYYVKENEDLATEIDEGAEDE